MIFFYLVHLTISIFSLYLHIGLLKTKGEALFSFPLFLIAFIFIFFLRFIRLPIRHFYFLSFCPVVTTFFSYFSPLSGSLASLFAIFIFGIWIMKSPFYDSLYSGLSYLSGALFISLIRYFKFLSDFNVLIYALISALLYPLFFYIPLIMRSKASIRSHLYILFWEHSFLFFYIAFIFLCYFSIMERNFARFFLLLPLFIISVIALKESLKGDKLFLLHRIENFLAGTFSLERALRKINRILKSHISFDYMKVYVNEKDKFICVYSNEESFKDKVFNMDVFEDIKKRERVYVKKVMERPSFVSDNTLSFLAIPLFEDKKLRGFMLFESKYKDNFSEDDQERLMMVSLLVSRIIGSYLLLQEMPKVSESIKEKSQKVIGMLKEFSSFISKLELSFFESVNVFKGISDKINKNFGILEGVASEFERGSKEILDFAAFFKGKRGEIQSILLRLKEKEGSFEKLIEDFQKLKGNIFETISLFEKIEGFIEFMKDYASKTRLLSLNASIEATRLGEEAKGFSIIAEEIGNLAQSVENIITKLTQEFSSVANIFEDTKSTLEEYEKLMKGSKDRYLEYEEREKDMFITLIDILPKIEDLPHFFEKWGSQLSDIIKTIGEELQDVETANAKMKEVIKELRELKSGIEKVEDALGGFKVFSDKIKLLDELFRKGEE